MKKRTKEDKKRAEDRRITYLSTPATTSKKVTKAIPVDSYSNKDLIKSFVVSILMFFVLYLFYRFWL